MGEHKLPKDQNAAMLFLDEKAIFVDKIAYLDFACALPEGLNHGERFVEVVLIEGSTIQVKNSDIINFLIQHFVPQGMQSKYQSSISIVRN